MYFLLWNIIAAFSLAYLEVLGIFKGCSYWDEYWLLHWFFFNFILELMRTANDCADKPILLRDTLWQLADGLSCKGLQKNDKDAGRRMGPTYLKPVSSIFLLVFSVLSPNIFSSLLVGWVAFLCYVCFSIWFNFSSKSNIFILCHWKLCSNNPWVSVWGCYSIRSLQLDSILG